MRGILGWSDYDLSRLRGLDAPTALATSDRATIATWTCNDERILDYVEKLSVVTARADLLAAFEGLTRSRAAITRDGVALSAGLGGRACDLERPGVSRTITLPELSRSHRERKPRKTPRDSKAADDASETSPRTANGASPRIRTGPQAPQSTAPVDLGPRSRTRARMPRLPTGAASPAVTAELMRRRYRCAGWTSPHS